MSENRYILDGVAFNFMPDGESLVRSFPGSRNTVFVMRGETDWTASLVVQRFSGAVITRQANGNSREEAFRALERVS